MPWVRIDDNAIDHPKILALSDAAFRLWIRGLSHCRRFLTDGKIERAVLSQLPGVSKPRIRELLRVGLWEATETGYVVHDYHQWNDSRDVILAARQDAQARRRGGRASVKPGAKTETKPDPVSTRSVPEQCSVLGGKKAKIEAKLDRKSADQTVFTEHENVANVAQNPEQFSVMPSKSAADGSADVRPNVRAGVGSSTGTNQLVDPNHPDVQPTAQLDREGGTGETRAAIPTNGSKRPIFAGHRLVVFEWLLVDLRRMLGPFTNEFHLDEWFDALDQRALHGEFVIPPRDGGKWLKAQTLAEAQRRGLPIATDSNGSERTPEDLAAAVSKQLAEREARTCKPTT